MSHLNTNFDNDFDSFLNLDNNDFTPVSASSSADRPVQQSFSGPSYQYDLHKQQTGLPMGGLANAFAVNQASGLSYRPNSMGYVMPTETLNVPLMNNLDDFEYNRNQSVDMNDMDFDAESPSEVSNMFYSNGESSQSAPIQRIYPGMHSQQAAQTKAAQALKQQEMLRQQQQPKQIAGQRPLPTQAPKAPVAKDPHVEESISRLLNRMRQSSSASADDEGDDSAGGMNSITRPKKEEEDMDEDERLLASEEGKKLSSKERRQLRNKVSARAFRSRRKEYITQLESEVQQKAQEANDLRVQNRQLMEENNRLTDLTRMLLSSSAFSGFLQELSNSGIPAPQINLSNTQSSQQPSQVRKDVSAHEAARRLQNQNQPQVNMPTVPENNMSMNGIENWNALSSNDFQVYSVSYVPAVPMLDLSGLQDKPLADDTSAKSVPEIPSLPEPKELAESTVPEGINDEVADSDKELFDLYCTESSAKSTHDIESTQSFIASLNKPESQDDEQKSVVSNSVSTPLSQLQDSCSELDRTYARLADLMPQARY